MSSPAPAVDWLADGTPFNPRFDDIYTSCAGGWDQARHVFLGGCGLPAAWAHQPQWRILETGFGLGLNFLTTWQAWRADPARPRLLHFASVEAWPVAPGDLLRAVEPFEALRPLAAELAAQWWGLTPGFQRLAFDGGRVLLTLCVGDVKPMLRDQRFEADSVYLDGFSPRQNPAMWEPATIEAMARCCRRGTTLATWSVARGVRDALAQCGFTVEKAPGLPPKRDSLRAVYAPAWTPRKRRPQEAVLPAGAPLPGRAVVVGAGLAGAAAAASLARRGWQVEVLDAAPEPAGGASGLPAGVLAPRVSTDDGRLARLTRAGLRQALREARALLRDGEDWAETGVLEHRAEAPPAPHGKPLPPLLPDPLPDALKALADTSRLASPEQLAQAGLPPGARALWHVRAGWVRPARLVRAWLAQPGIAWRGNARVDRLRRDAPANPADPADPAAPVGWQILAEDGRVLARADLVVLAAGPATVGLLERSLGASPRLQSLRGQVSSGPAAPGLALPPFPVNGHGSLVPAVPGPDGPRWVMGASFERVPPGTAPACLAADQAENRAKLAALLPAHAAALASGFDDLGAAWAGLRCASTDRLPLVGPVADDAPGLCLLTALGSRGLTWAVLAAELLAARLHGEPWPLDQRLGDALDARRFNAPAGAAPAWGTAI